MHADLLVDMLDVGANRVLGDDQLGLYIRNVAPLCQQREYLRLTRGEAEFTHNGFQTHLAIVDLTHGRLPRIRHNGRRTHQTFMSVAEEVVEKGITVKTETIEELAEKIGLPAANFAKTVEAHNANVAENTDPEFQRGTAFLLSDNLSDTPSIEVFDLVPLVIQ